MTARPPVTLTRLPRRLPEIRPLTGLRIVAALLVVFFHIRGNLRAAFPEVTDAVWPILDSGLLGVDLFFGLSGFVLTINYVDAVGVRLSRSGTARFLWARIARIWPAYAVTLLIAAVWHAGLPVIRWTDPVPVDDFSAASFLRQVTLVVLWTEDDYDRLTWNGPAWSVSAEALAYTVFPVLALLLFRLDRTLRARTVGVLAMVTLVPLLAVGSAGLHGPWTWSLRLACAFLAGSLAALAVRKVWAHVDEHRLRAWPTVLTWGSLLGIVATLYASYELDRSAARVLATAFFPLLLIGLSLSKGMVARLLATRAFVFGGRISYSVYLTHMVLVIEPYWALQTRWPDALPDDSPVSQAYFLATPVLACVTGWLLWRLVEEPAQRRMRAMVVKDADGPSGPELPAVQPARDTTVIGDGRYAPAVPDPAEVTRAPAATVGAADGVVRDPDAVRSPVRGR